MSNTGLTIKEKILITLEAIALFALPTLLISAVIICFTLYQDILKNRSIMSQHENLSLKLEMLTSKRDSLISAINKKELIITGIFKSKEDEQY